MAEQSDKDTKLAQDLNAQLKNCIGYDGDELGTARKEAYDYYFQRARGDEVAGRSSVVTGDLSSMVEGNLAQMTEPLSSKRIGEFCAYSSEDEEQAQLESDCVNELIFKRNNGFVEVTAAIKDAMLLRNAVAKIWIDKRKYKKTVRKENVEPEIVEELVHQLTNTDSLRGVKTSVEVHSINAEEKTASFTVVKDTKKFCVEALPLENLLIPKDWNRYDLESINFLAERHVEARSTLIERGFDKNIVASLPKWANKYGETATARLPRNFTPNSLPLDNSQEKVEWFECYARLDDGSGASELRRISVSDSKILENEETDIICYAAGAIIINPHSFIAISLHDKLKSTQDTSTALTRALLDNVNTTNKNRAAYLDGVVEEIDMTDGRTNGAIRVKPGLGIQDVRQAVTAFAVQDTSANILSNLENARRTRSEMGGATLDMATGQSQLSDRVGSQGLDRAYSVMEQLASFFTKMIAQTLIRQMYLIAHEVLRTQWEGPISFKRGNKWVIQEPSKWQVRESVQINLGASLGERARQGAVLEKVMAKQEGLAAQGMEDILVGAPNYYTAIMAWLRINDIANPEQYFIDPRTDGSIKAFKQRAVMRAQDKQKQDALMQQAIGLEQLRVALDKYKSDADLQFKYYDAVLDAQIEEAKLTTGAVVDISKARFDAQRIDKNADTGAEKSNGAKPTGKRALGGNPF